MNALNFQTLHSIIKETSLGMRTNQNSKINLAC
jgi:hypothetical protein